MIRRIKRKYIFVVMVAVVVVLGFIITAINVTNFTSVNSLLDEKVTMLVNNEGLMPELPFGEKPEEDNTDDDKTDDNTDDVGDEEQDDEDSDTDSDKDNTEDDNDGKNDKDESDKKEDDFYQHMSPETPYELRYFSVKLDTDGEVIDVDTSKITAVDRARAEEYAKGIFNDGRYSGFIDSYKFKFGETEDGNLIYVFLDVDREIQSFKSFLVSSLVITAIGTLAVFVLVVILSETALKPIIESYEKQKRFITDAGHEMKTPLAVISANAEIIEIESGESQWVDGIKSQVSKLASLTEKLVVLSKMEEGIKLEMSDFSLTEAFFDTFEQYKGIARSRGVECILSIHEGVNVVGNEGEIRRCISLLLDNAFRYVNDGGTVEVTVQKSSSGAEMKFINSTNGVEKGSLDRWFDRFYRTDLSRNSATGGSGIGLSVVKAIVLAHSGEIKAKSEDGINVEFTINI